MGQFTLPELPYAYDELEPYLDARTLEIHHGKHHAAYVATLNQALDGQSPYQNASVEELLSNLNDVSEDIRTTVRNHGGGHYGHSLFWSIMSPNGGGKPYGDISKGIEKHFGSFEQFKDDLSKAAVSRFGSGWGWLVVNGDKLEVMSTSNQDTPFMENKTPILVVDVWEHAYYLQYQNKRPDFVSAWWNVVNWEEVNRRYNEAFDS
ncbi:superoxide dismutase [Paenibacillus apiarius]|uniref:Superoxide dismutase n=1 Tax=Paenibacillus apiarius TaxID=46240 RepID=A0ABT4DNN2_9BACL|nr:superoxide dismutase [Paenibacillus apiarius]MCY9512975.1 superoxide dismutase [Paenibacillus apiarius]MCY9518959.1 superoxide dismutase [Paenibacillus apiarius]MCY9550768.1 superoxide dismutase [Paenibacillus apiarius]MCY9559798.1 superoxide dismutase [Paenibacillus apiarius]MCY9682041.1 superoxide dismutase [Paenibacillus apiarius]